MKPPRRLLLVGWEAAEWPILNPLLDGGSMPAFGRLVEHGASGVLHSVPPPGSAIQWTTLATGKRAWQHGVCHALETTGVPVTAQHRRAAALWDILEYDGRRTLVAGWPATHGTQHGGSIIVSDRYAEPTAPPGTKPWPPARPGTYWPEDIGASMNKLRCSPDDIVADLMARYVPLWRKIDQKRDHRLGHLSMLLAADLSYQTALLKLLATGEWDFAAVRFPALGGISRIFMPYHPLRRGAVAEDEFQLYRLVVNTHYLMLDLMLERLVALAGPEAAVAVVSNGGIFAAQGPGFLPDALLHGASALDVAPTLLAWFGLPIGDDMEGRVLLECLPEMGAIERVPEWESRLGRSSQVEMTKPIQGNATLWWEQARNYGQSCMEAGRYETALPALQELFRDFPERADNSHALFQCQIALNLQAEAEETLSVYLETVPPGVVSLLPRAELAWAKRDLRQARRLVDELQQLNPNEPSALRRLGLLLLRLRDWDALAALARRVLQTDENDAIAWLGLAEAQLRRGEAPQAAGSARRAIGLKYFLPEAHYALARALVAQGKWPEAREAMQTLLKLQPNHRTAPAYLKRMPPGNNIDKSG